MAVTLADIHATQEYKDLLLMGSRDLGSATRSNRPELKVNIENPTLGRYTSSRGSHIGNYTIFQTGYIRLFTDKSTMVRNAVGQDKRYVMNITEWENHMRIVGNELMKKIMLQEMGVNPVTAKYVSSSIKGLKNQYGYLISNSPNAFMLWLKGLEKENIESILDVLSLEMIALISAKPNQWAHTLKSISKNPAIKRIISKLPSGVAHTFAGDLGLAGDLHDLGF